MLAFVALLAAPALAGPARCEAVWEGPGDRCPLHLSLGATATWRTEAGAERRARARIAEAAAEAVRLRAERLDADEREREARECAEEAAERAHVECLPDPVLDGWALCFADLPGAPEGCAPTSPLFVEERGWRASERAREALCAEVAARRPGDAACRLACLQSSRVRCHPAERSGGMPR